MGKNNINWVFICLLVPIAAAGCCGLFCSLSCDTDREKCIKSCAVYRDHNYHELHYHECVNRCRTDYYICTDMCNCDDPCCLVEENANDAGDLLKNGV